MRRCSTCGLIVTCTALRAVYGGTNWMLVLHEVRWLCIAQQCIMLLAVVVQHDGLGPLGQMFLLHL